MSLPGDDGIGAAAARLLKALGARVVIVGRPLEKTQMTARELSIPYYMADYAKCDAVGTLAARLRAVLPRMDVIVNRAGGVMEDSNEQR